MENNIKKKFYKDNRFWMAIVVLVIFIGAISLANNMVKGKNKEVVDNTKVEEQTTTNNVDEEKAEEVSKKVVEGLNNKNIMEVEVISDSGTEKPEVYIQLKLEVEKANVDKASVENEVASIVEKVKTIGNECQMEIVDSNMELVALYLDGSTEFKE